MNRKKGLLLLLVAVLLAAIYYAYRATPVPRRVDKPSAATRADGPGRSGETGGKGEQTLLLDRLQQRKQGSAAVARDIFSFYQRPVAVAPPVRREPIKAPPPPPPPPPAMPEPPPAPVVEPVRIKYLGLLKKDDRRMFFLEIEDEIAVVGPGESFGKQGQYVVKAFDGEQLVIGRGQGQDDLTLRVSEPVERSGSADAVATPPGESPLTRFNDAARQRARTLPRRQIFQPQNPSAANP